MEINSSLTSFLNPYCSPNNFTPSPQPVVELPPPAKNIQEIEEDTVSFGNSTVETEWEQYPFNTAPENLMAFEEESSENSVYAHDGSFSEKDDDFLFNFEEDAEDLIDVCYFKKEKYVSCRRKMKGAKANKKKKRNVLLEAWSCIRKLFLRYLACRNALLTVKQDFHDSYNLWQCDFASYKQVFMKFACRIPHSRISLGVLRKDYSQNPYIYSTSRTLRRLFTSFIEEKAEICVNRMERISETMKEILLELIILFKRNLEKNNL